MTSDHYGNTPIRPGPAPQNEPKEGERIRM